MYSYILPMCDVQCFSNLQFLNIFYQIKQVIFYVFHTIDSLF